MTVAVAPSVARVRVDRIKTGVEVIWSLIVESYQARDWEALGYSTWDELCTREFGTSRLALPREERPERVASLREAGLSIRAIRSATGLAKDTITKAIEVSQAGTPAPPTVVDVETGEVLDEPEGFAAKIAADLEASEEDRPAPVEPAKVTGIDGKSYSHPVKRAPYRKPLIDVAKTKGFAMRQAADALLKVFEDDRYRTNEKQVADVLRGHLLYVAETVAAVIDQLP